MAPSVWVSRIQRDLVAALSRKSHSQPLILEPTFQPAGAGVVPLPTSQPKPLSLAELTAFRKAYEAAQAMGAPNV